MSHNINSMLGGMPDDIEKGGVINEIFPLWLKCKSLKCYGLITNS